MCMHSFMQVCHSCRWAIGCHQPWLRILWKFEESFVRSNGRSSGIWLGMAGKNLCCRHIGYPDSNVAWINWNVTFSRKVITHLQMIWWVMLSAQFDWMFLRIWCVIPTGEPSAISKLRTLFKWRKWRHDPQMPHFLERKLSLNKSR